MQSKDVKLSCDTLSACNTLHPLQSRSISSRNGESGTKITLGCEGGTTPVKGLGNPRAEQLLLANIVVTEMLH